VKNKVNGKSKYDVLVIGSGISGLTAALLFAKDGKKVAIVEQSPHIAPLICGFDRRGVHFETGFHYSAGCGKDGIGIKMLKELGIEIPFELCEDESYDEIRILDKNKSVKIPFEKLKLEQKLAELFPKEKENIKKYLDLIENTKKKISFLYKDVKDLSHDELLNFSDNGKTLQNVLDECFTDNDLKALLAHSYILYGTPPSKVSFAVHCCCVSLMMDSVWKIRGGGRALVSAFSEALRKNNVDVFTNKKAVKIETDGNEKTICFEDGARMKCDFCVSSVHPKEFIKMAPEGVYRANAAKRIKDIEETPAFFVLYGILRDSKKYKCSNIAFVNTADYARPLYSGEVLPAYINFSDTDPQSVCVVAFVKPDKIYWDRNMPEYEEKKQKTAKEIKDKFAKIAPEIASKIEYCDIATPATFKKYVNYYSGYGIMHASDGVNVLPVTKIPGIFLTGQAVVTPGLLGALISSFLLYKIIERDGR